MNFLEAEFRIGHTDFLHNFSNHGRIETTLVIEWYVYIIMSAEMFEMHKCRYQTTQASARESAESYPVREYIDTSILISSSGFFFACIFKSNEHDVSDCMRFAGTLYLIRITSAGSFRTAKSLTGQKSGRIARALMRSQQPHMPRESQCHWSIFWSIKWPS